MSRVRPGSDQIAGMIVAIVVTIFIGTDIVESTGWDWRAWLRSIKGSFISNSRSGEIRNYVEFTTLKHNGLNITTGVRFASSNNRKITMQWCYVHPASSNFGDVGYQLFLAGKTGTGPTVSYRFTQKNLRPFKLSEAQARSLIETQCRFRK